MAGPAGGLPGCKVAAERAGPGRSRCPQKQPIGCGLELPGGAGHAAVRLACRAPHPAPRTPRPDTGQTPPPLTEARLCLRGLPRWARPPTRPGGVSRDTQPPADADGSYSSAAWRRLARGCSAPWGPQGPVQRDGRRGRQPAEALTSVRGCSRCGGCPGAWGSPQSAAWWLCGPSRAPGRWLACGQPGPGGRGSRHTQPSRQVTGTRSWPACTCSPGASTRCTAWPCTAMTTPGPTSPAWTAPCGREPPPPAASRPRAPRRGPRAR